jgi:3'-phosphoadenosine 5'-phosphosulfate (PAPS) 3'-phosphatase
MLDLRNPQPLLVQLCTIAAAAGTAILEVYGRDFAVHYKADRSPLTEADEVSQRIIAERLRALDNSIPILSEESAPPDPADGPTTARSTRARGAETTAVSRSRFTWHCPPPSRRAWLGAGVTRPANSPTILRRSDHTRSRRWVAR